MKFNLVHENGGGRKRLTGRGIPGQITGARLLNVDGCRFAFRGPAGAEPREMNEKCNICEVKGLLTGHSEFQLVRTAGGPQVISETNYDRPKTCLAGRRGYPSSFICIVPALPLSQIPIHPDRSGIPSPVLPVPVSDRIIISHAS